MASRPDDMDLPTREQIAPSSSPDELSAGEHFFGKSMHQAEEMFRTMSSYYGEDLMWMGPVAYRFYIRAAIAYLKSDASNGDFEMAETVARTLRDRLKREPTEVMPIAEELAELCGHLAESEEKFDWSGDFFQQQRKFLKLRESFEKLATQYAVVKFRREL